MTVDTALEAAAGDFAQELTRTVKGVFGEAAPAFIATALSEVGRTSARFVVRPLADPVPAERLDRLTSA